MKTSETRRERAPWSVVPADADAVSAVARATGLSPITARVLVSRGIVDADAARRFLHPSLVRDWYSPWLLPDMHAAVDDIEHAVRSGASMVVFGDFDLDGVSATALLVRALRVLGAHVEPVIPLRFEEGYGLSVPAMERLVESFDPALVVTVDCGVAGADEVEWLVGRGISVVVTDHHEPSGAVPVGVPVVNPKLDPACPSCDLSGAGVALKLVAALGERFGRPELWLEYTDLATLGTIADLMDLSGENRSLVAHGVDRLIAAPRAGVTALCAVAGTTPDKLTSDGISFTLSPRLNAAGRMGDAGPALDLLLEDDLAQAERIAFSLDAANRKRQELEADLAEAASALAERTRDGRRLVVVSGEGWHEGIKGIVASRLVGRYGVPALLFSIHDGIARGSGRSVGSVDLFAAVESLSELLIRFGGHKAAVGVTLPADRLEEFTERLATHMDGLPEEQFTSALDVDALVRLDDLSLELLAELDALRPFGQGNRKPLFAAECVFMNGRSRVGRGEDHLRFTAYDGISELPAIAFRCNDIAVLAEHDAPVDIAFEPSADEWRGRTRIQLIARSIVPCDTPAESPAKRLVEELFERADEYLAREEYSGIVDEPTFNTKLVGVTFEGRQEHIAALVPATPLRLERRPDNPYDANAIAVLAPDGTQVGFLNRRLAAVLAPAVDKGVEYDIELTEVTGGEDGKSLGVNVRLMRRDLAAVDDLEVFARESRLELSRLSGSTLEDELRKRFIGESSLHDAQIRSLELLDTGASVLTVMATGRGKSLIFHLHAARISLRGGGASVFVFPLRALVSDQAHHLERTFARLGLTVAVITGESAQSRRDEVFSALAAGDVDVLLTTPEFLQFHVGRFAESGRIRFMVVDEAHHVAASRAGHRPAYAELGTVRRLLGEPTVLAVSATVDTRSAEVIRSTLRIDRIVEDPTVRANLELADHRRIRDKDAYVAAVVARGEKVVVYVNSREQTVRLARMLRARVPAVAHRIAFYNGGLSRATRALVEEEFRGNGLSVVVSTSAFGEGVNIPDIRHVVLYHLPFSAVEFNQMAGRAGRDGRSATIHLVFGQHDARINETILSSGAPVREDMAILYRTLKRIQDVEGPAFEMTNAEIAERSARTDAKFTLDERGVSSALGIFRELGLVTGEGHGPYRRLTLPEVDVKVELDSSVRYLEGLDELAQFAEFKRGVFEASADDLLRRFNRPILPSSGSATDEAGR